MQTKNFLKHHGVLGMKWGHRKGSSVTVNHTPKVTSKDGKHFDKHGHEVSTDFAKKVILKNKKVREMSNSELRTLNERLQLERQFSDLRSNERQQQIGLNAVKKITAAGTTIASLYALSQTPLARDVTKLVKAKMS